MKPLNSIKLSGRDVLPLVEGGKGIAVSNGESSGAWAAAGGAALVTADHGNCETMWDDENNCPHTAHTLNDTPCVVIVPGFEGPLRAGGALCDVAPTLLGMMGVAQPPEMTGEDLRI